MSWLGTMIGLPLAGRQDVVRRHHQHARFELRFERQRHVDGHLVAVEVGVERRADQRMQLDRLAFDQHRLERLDAQAVQRRRAVQQHGMLADDLLEDVPHFRPFFLDHALGGLDGGRHAVELELRIDERLEQLERHLLRQAALVQLELRADDDDRTARVVDALAEQPLGIKGSAKSASSASAAAIANAVNHATGTCARSAYAAPSAAPQPSAEHGALEPTPSQPTSGKIEFWQSARNSGSVSELNSYLSQYPNGEMRTVAEGIRRLIRCEQLPSQDAKILLQQACLSQRARSKP